MTEHGILHPTMRWLYLLSHMWQMNQNEYHPRSFYAAFGWTDFTPNRCYICIYFQYKNNKNILFCPRCKLVKPRFRITMVVLFRAKLFRCYKQKGYFSYWPQGGAVTSGQGGYNIQKHCREICYVQVSTYPSHKVDQVVDCNPWNFVQSCWIMAGTGTHRHIHEY